MEPSTVLPETLRFICQTNCALAPVASQNEAPSWPAQNAGFASGVRRDYRRFSNARELECTDTSSRQPHGAVQLKYLRDYVSSSHVTTHHVGTPVKPARMYVINCSHDC